MPIGPRRRIEMQTNRSGKRRVAMGNRLAGILGVTLCASLVTVGICSPQQDGARRSSPDQANASIPKQRDDQEEWRQGLQAKAKQNFDAEAERERSGDRSTSNTTADFDHCFGQRLEETAINLKNFDGVIRQLQSGPPQMSGSAAETTARPAGPELAPAQHAAEFDRLENAWQRYGELACEAAFHQAAFHQFDGGTGAPSFQMQCELKLTRDHLRELDLIYGSDLHL
jgi:uncharacterized protein YecT (DUF1311 family)